MSKNKFITLTLANGGKPVIIRPQYIALAMRIEDKADNGSKIFYTRIIPKDIVIDETTNWIDVKETPAEIVTKMQ